MSTFYTSLQGTADSLIRQFGSLMIVTHQAQGTYNASSGQKTVTKTNYNVPIVTFPYEMRLINGTTIKDGDLWGYFSAVGLSGVPQVGDKLAHKDGFTYTFGRVKPLNPDGATVLLYECHLTRG